MPLLAYTGLEYHMKHKGEEQGSEMPNMQPKCGDPEMS